MNLTTEYTTYSPLRRSNPTRRSFIRRFAKTELMHALTLDGYPIMQSETRSWVERNRLLNSYTLICSLPSEILSTIFILGQALELRDSFLPEDQSVSEASPPYAPFEVLMTHVSFHFREIAIATHLLWTSISVTSTRPIDEIEAYITRSAACGLSVRVERNHQPVTDREVAGFGLVLPLCKRYHQLTINSIQESIDNPIIRCFSEWQAPSLERLSLSVNKVEGLVNTDTRLKLLMGGAPMLSFVRLRGLAMSLFDLPLGNATTLHLDQTLPLPIHYTTFRQLITASPALRNLSIYGDMISGTVAWPGALDPIDMPTLRSLRLCGIGGAIYNGLLLGLNAPNLESLVLKDVQEYDLDQFWASSDVSKFPLLRHLSFNDFEVSSHVYANIFRTFPSVTSFTTTSSARQPRILQLLAEPNMAEPHASPWPMLHTLSFILSLDDDQLIKDVIQARNDSGCPLGRLCVGTSHGLPLLPSYCWIQENVTLEGFQDEQWPIPDSYLDPDDVLFY